MPKFYLDYLTNEDSYITTQLKSVFQSVIEQIPFAPDELNANLLNEDYAWTVHCNLVMGAIDAELDTKRSAMAATEFLNERFGVDVSRNPLWWNTYRAAAHRCALNPRYSTIPE